MSRLKMSWDYVDGIQVVVFTQYHAPNNYQVRIMISRRNIPNNPLTTPRAKPWKTGWVHNCKSHAQCQASTFNYLKQWFTKYGNPCIGPEQEPQLNMQFLHNN